MPNAERTGMHHNAAKALLHKIDSNKGAFKTAEQRKAAVQSILAANHHTRVTAAGKVKSHDINSMMALADSLSRNVGETTKYPANAATLFEYGSSQLKKSYLKDELHYEAPTALSEVVGVCDSIPQNPNCNNIDVRRTGGMKYCISCRQWLLDEDAHLRKIGCSNPYDRSECHGKAAKTLKRTGAHVLCGGCLHYRWKQRRSADGKAIITEDTTRTAEEQDGYTPSRPVVKQQQKSAKASRTQISEPTERLLNNEEKLAKVSEKGQLDDRHVKRTVELSSFDAEYTTISRSPVQQSFSVLIHSNPPGACGQDDEEGPEECADTDEGEESNADEDELGQEESLQQAHQPRTIYNPVVSTARSVSPRDQDPAPLRSLKSIPGNYHERRSAQSTTILISEPGDTITVSSQSRQRGSNKRRSHTDDYDPIQDSSNAKRQRTSQTLADELQNDIGYRLRPSQIQKEWGGVFKLLQDTIIFYCNDVGADVIQKLQLVPRTERNRSLNKLYRRVLGSSEWRVSAMQNAGLLPAYHFLMSLIGCVIYEVMQDGGRQPWLIKSNDERTPYLQKSSRPKRAEYAWICSDKFKDQHITPQASNLAHDYAQVLRKHLSLMYDETKTTVNFEYCLYRFGQNLESVLGASLLLKAKITILMGLAVSWPVSGDKLIREHMRELNDADQDEGLIVTMTLLPILVNMEKNESISKAIVCCHTVIQEQGVNLGAGQ